MDFSNYFYYDETSPSGLRWKISRYTGKNYSQEHIKANSQAGSLASNGYWQVSLNYRSYKVHRIIMQLHGAEIASKHIDHIDGNRQNNKLHNLRAISPEMNPRNAKRYSTNTSGYTGVSHVAVNGHGYIRAFWCEEGKVRQKYFSISKLGKEQAVRMALAFRENKLKDLNNAGFGYTERHGT